MDIKRKLIAMVLILAVVLGYEAFLRYYVKPRRPDVDWSGAHNAPQPEQPSSSTASATSLPTSSTNPSIGPSTAPMLAIAAIPENQQTLLLGSRQPGNPDYSVGLEIDPKGAGLNSVVLNDFKQSADSQQIYTFQQPYPDHLDQLSMATSSITVNGAAIDVWDKPWAAQKNGKSDATYSLTLTDQAQHPMLRVEKTYSVLQRNAPAPNNLKKGYEVGLTYHLQNPTTQPITVQLAFNGPTTPAKEVERGVDRRVISGYNKDGQQVEVEQHAVEEFKAGNETRDLTKNDKGYGLLWAGVGSVYFNAIIQPADPAQFTRVDASDLNPGEPVDKRDVGLLFHTTEIKIEPGKSVDIPMAVFFGPKQRDLLNNEYYSAFPRSYDLTLIMASGLCGFCTLPWLINALVYMLIGFHKILLHDWGLSIIALVIVVRVLLHPITKRSQVSMMKMGKMGPEMERLKKKFGDDKEGLQKAQMELYKNVGFTPILGCLPMFLQMPIWIALYSALQNEFSLRQAGFLRFGHIHLTWINDLAKPDRLFSWDKNPLHINLLFTTFTIAGLNILPIFMAVVFFLQQKYTPKPPATTPEQASQQKMMQWMSLLFPVMLYTGPSGLNLYILTSTTIGIIESKVIRNHIKQREEEEKAGRVIVDMKPTRAGKRKKDVAVEPEKKGCLTGWLTELQAKAEEIRRDGGQRKK